MCISNMHNHSWVLVDKDVIAEFQKGMREIFKTVGNFEKCEGCSAGRLVPHDKALSPVDCEKISPSLPSVSKSRVTSKKTSSKANGRQGRI